jgi:DNA polymerase-3 subunit gamma/tau
MGNSSLDVLEMDAASNRGIDEIRDLRDRVNLAPAAGRMKVYIIDEVHMLTAEAFNALLKMLEEPPEHVVFVLATTEKHKVLPTIISRCQSFDFRRPSVETLVEKLAEISEAESIEVEPEALTVIAREGRGSFRDAEGLLDQLSSFAEGRITAPMVRELLGGVGPESLVETTYALHERRAPDALRIVDRLSGGGKDLGQFVGELLAHLRNLMLLPYAPEVALAGVGAEERPPLEEQANAIPTAEVVRLVTALDDAMNRMRRGGDPKLELELVFLKLTRDYTEPDLASILARLETLENTVENGGGPATSSPRPAPDVVRQESPGEPEAPSDSAPDAEERDEREGPAVDLASEWQGIMGELKRRRQALTAAVYGEARVESFDGEVLRLVYPEEQGFHVGMARDKGHIEKLTAVLEGRLGTVPRLEIRASVGEATSAATPEESPPPASSIEEPAPAVEDSTTESRSPNGSGGTAASNSGPGAAGNEGVIRNQREVFEIAREALDEN